MDSLIFVLAGLLLVGLCWLMGRRTERWLHSQSLRPKLHAKVRRAAFGNTVYNTQNIRVERYYFTTGHILQAGQPLVFQDNPATSASTKGFGMDVKCPDANTKNAFAGIVHPNSVGFTGPGYIDVLVPAPGDILQVLCASVASDQSIGYACQLDNAIPTASSTATSGPGNGGFRVVDLFTLTFASNTTISFGGTAMSALYQAKCRLLESFASVSASAAGARALKWVEFF